MKASQPHISLQFSRQKEGHFCSQLVLTPTLRVELRSLAEVYSSKHDMTHMLEVLLEKRFTNHF